MIFSATIKVCPIEAPGRSFEGRNTLGGVRCATVTRQRAGEPVGNLSEEHGSLETLARRSVLALLEIRDSLTPATEQGSVWMQHFDFAERAGDLAEHLNAALTLADQALYASSLALVRTALEHQVLDELLLLAT